MFESIIMKHITSIFIFLSIFCINVKAQSGIVKDFDAVCDSLSILLQERTSVKGNLELKSIMKRSGSLDFYFTRSLGDFPWEKGDVEWFRKQLKELFPEKYNRFRLGDIYGNRIPLKRFVTTALGYDGRPSEFECRSKDNQNTLLVTDMDAAKYSKGLSGRHIALWQSHGRYFEQKLDRWEWQRPCLFQTCEDMFTQSFVLPYLVPMLENAGAYVMLPRERDTQVNEVICDNDPCTGGRGSGNYSESGKWSDAGEGFADPKPVYMDLENPFRMGSARKTSCIQNGRRDGAAEIIWRPDIPDRGRYAVYISYKSLPESTSSAVYTVVHMGGRNRFVVNQKIGGGTWIYLGTFEFDKGNSGYVRLDNRNPKGYKYTNGSVVTADAVRFGGGMGNIARSITAEDGCKDIVTSNPPEISGLPRSAEGARYWLQWAGADSTIYWQNEGKDDYKDDFMCRGDWVADMHKKGMPVDLAFGFHSDAGVTPNDSTVGTLAIYTYRSEGNTRYPSGEDRMTSREFAETVQKQLVADIRERHDTLWSRRSIWDRSYRESRTPTVPSMLLELLSHQNFADMKFGLDPEFRFTASRAIYKGMLKYLSNRYGCEYAVQPLPVTSLAVRFTEDGRKARLSWVPLIDSLEVTARPEGYIIETRVDGGAFDSGQKAGSTRNSDGRISTDISIVPGHIYSFRVRAFNEGGKSFPSETVCIGMPAEPKSGEKVLIVNNFDRVSCPAYVDLPEYAGFENDQDSGVADGKDISFVGEMHQFRRNLPWTDDDNPGFGASYCDYAGNKVAGNTSDFAYKHGKAIMSAGYPFYSCSNEAFCQEKGLKTEAWSIDLICGKQVTVKKNNTSRAYAYEVFPLMMQEAIRSYTKVGGNVLVSGAYIGTDIWDCIYTIQRDSTHRANSIGFAEKVLGYRWMSGHASRKGQLKPVANSLNGYGKIGRPEFRTYANETVYPVESPDGIIPSDKKGVTVIRYSDTGISAGINHDGGNYRTACFGFPLEVLSDTEKLEQIISITLDFFDK